MRILYSPHAKKRLRERKISKAEVNEAIKNADTILSADRGRIISRKLINGKTLEIIYVKEKAKTIIITLYYI